VVQALCYWRYYVIPKDFVLCSDHEPLKDINPQRKLNYGHGKWLLNTWLYRE
jgi:hypothetical protein